MWYASSEEPQFLYLSASIAINVMAGDVESDIRTHTENIKRKSIIKVHYCCLLPVMIHQHIDDIMETTRITWREEATVYLINSLSEFWKPVIVFLSIVPEQEK